MRANVPYLLRNRDGTRLYACPGPVCTFLTAGHTVGWGNHQILPFSASASEVGGVAKREGTMAEPRWVFASLQLSRAHAQTRGARTLSDARVCG